MYWALLLRKLPIGGFTLLLRPMSLAPSLAPMTGPPFITRGRPGARVGLGAQIPYRAR